MKNGKCFVYDGLGRLREQLQWHTNTSGGGGSSPVQLSGGPDISVGGNWTLVGGTYYIYDGNRVIQERDTNGVPTTSYTRGPDLSGTMEGAGGIGGLLARSSGYSSSTGNWSTHDYYHADGNGNITYLEDSSQGLAASYRYDPYGNLLSSSGPLASANTYRFSSKEYIPTAGFYYYLYRFYDAGFQRWINRDPLGNLGFAISGNALPARAWPLLPPGERIEGPNLYESALNNEIEYVDTDGRGLWGGLKNVAGQVGTTLKNNWGRLSSAAAAVCIVGPIYNACQQAQAAMNGWNNYNTSVDMLNAKYGGSEDWPPGILQYMNQWESALLSEFGQAAAACYEATPGNPATGPVTSPIR
jgi:RHS repeat-associated protein